jgi:hypothetical protein
VDAEGAGEDGGGQFGGELEQGGGAGLAGRRAIGVEQDEQAGDAVVWVDGVVVQQPAGLLPLAAR